MVESRIMQEQEPSYLIRDVTVNVALIMLGLFFFGFMRSARIPMMDVLVSVASVRIAVLFLQTLIHSFRHKRWPWFFAHLIFSVLVSVPYYFTFRAPESR